LKELIKDELIKGVLQLEEELEAIARQLAGTSPATAVTAKANSTTGTTSNGRLTEAEGQDKADKERKLMVKRIKAQMKGSYSETPKTQSHIDSMNSEKSPARHVDPNSASRPLSIPSKNWMHLPINL